MRNTLLEAGQNKERERREKGGGEGRGMKEDGTQPNFQIISPPLPFKYTEIDILSTRKVLELYVFVTYLFIDKVTAALCNHRYGRKAASFGGNHPRGEGSFSSSVFFFFF